MKIKKMKKQKKLLYKSLLKKKTRIFNYDVILFNINRRNQTNKKKKPKKKAL